MKVGDKVIIRNYNHPDQPHEYTIIEIDGRWIKAKHPSVEGYFCFDEDCVLEVVSGNR